MARAEWASVRRVREVLAGRGLSPGLVELEKTARSASAASAALGVRVEQIVKSLVLGGGRTERPIRVLAIGGVPPVGHAERPVIFVYEDLMRHEEVWTAAGRTHVVFGLSPGWLPEITPGKVVRITRADR